MYRVPRAVLSSLALMGLILFMGAHSLVMGQAAATAASLTGTIADSSGAVIGGATISVKNIDTNLTREATSAEDGSYIIQQLPPGRYEVTVSADGFKTDTTSLSLVLGTTTRFNFNLEIGARTDIIEVQATDISEEGKTESSTNVDRQRIDALPINRRNFLDFSLTAPRVTADRAPAQGASATSGLSFNGQTARQNNITIDGFDNNDSASGSVRSTFSQEAVQEFQVVSDSYSAEFGRALGGVVNIVTRGGGNDLHGGIFFFNRNDETSARDVFAPFEPDFKQYQFGASLSGPFKKDRAFFFTAFERLTIGQNNFVNISPATLQSARNVGFNFGSGPVPFSNNNTTFLARTDFRLTPSDTLYVRYNYGGTTNGNFEPFGGLVADTNGGIQVLDDNSIAVSNTYLNAGLNLVNETRFLYARRNQDVLQRGPGPQVRLIAPEGQVTFGRGTFLPQFREERIYQIVNNVSLTRGRNNLKFGVDFLRVDLPDRKTNVPIFPGGLTFFTPIDFAALNNLPGLPFFTGIQAFDPSTRTPQQIAFLNLLTALIPRDPRFPGFPQGVPFAQLPLPLVYIQGFGDTGLEVPTSLFSAFFQDEIRVKQNFLVKAGVRYDIVRTRFVPENDGNFAPRFGFTYRPGFLSKMNIRGQYGIFFSGPQVIGAAFAVQNTTGSGAQQLPVIPFPFSVLPFSLPGRGFPESTTLPPGVTVTPQLSQSFQYDQKLKNSYTQQVTFGFDYLLATDLVVAVGYDYVRGVRLFSTRNINPIVRRIADPVTNALFGRVDPRRGDVFQFESAFDSYYHAVTFSVNKRFSKRFGFLAHYTISKGIDDFLDIRTDLQETVDPLNPRQERGLSLQDVRNRFVLSGIWDLSYTKNPILTGFQLSTITTITSGRPYNLLAGVDLNGNGDNPPGDRPLIGNTPIGRNVGITPDFANVDLRLTRTITINERVRIQGIAELFNLFNRVNISDVDRIFLPDLMGRFNLPRQESGRFVAPRERFRNAFSPRQFQFGFRVNF